MPFSLLEAEDGGVLVYVGQAQWVVDPLTGDYFELDGAAAEAKQVRSLTLYERATELRGKMSAEDIYVEVKLPKGVLHIEQTGPNSLGIGCLDLELQQDGTFMGRGEDAPPVYFHRNGRAEVLEDVQESNS